jgi:hypothetical protein
MQFGIQSVNQLIVEDNVMTFIQFKEKWGKIYGLSDNMVKYLLDKVYVEPDEIDDNTAAWITQSNTNYYCIKW